MAGALVHHPQDIALVDETLRLCSLTSATGRQCANDQFCARSRFNPNDGVTSFDNILVAWLTIIQAMSLEGWTDVMYWVRLARTIAWCWFGDSVCAVLCDPQVSEVSGKVSQIYFVLLILVGSLFVINLVVEVIGKRFEQT